MKCIPYILPINEKIIEIRQVDLGITYLHG